MEKSTLDLYNIHYRVHQKQLKFNLHLHKTLEQRQFDF